MSNQRQFAEPLSCIVRDKDDWFNILCIRLYLYVKPDSLLPLLSSKKILLSKPWKTNDVTECVQQSKEKQSEKIKEYGYICLSCRSDSSAMWGYYADSSRGACLAFDIPVEKLKKGQYRILDEDDTSLLNNKIIRSVEYRDCRVKGTNTIDLLHRKATEWAHEEEYRIVLSLKDVNHEIEEKHKNVSYYDESLFSYLKHIVLGVHSPHECSDIRANLKDLKLNNINVTRAKFSAQHFSYNIPDTSYSLQSHTIPNHHTYLLTSSKDSWRAFSNDDNFTSKKIKQHFDEMEQLCQFKLSNTKICYWETTDLSCGGNVLHCIRLIIEHKNPKNIKSIELFYIENRMVHYISSLSSKSKARLYDILKAKFPPTK